MNNDKFIELMNRDIDGAISPAEQAELRAFLAGNAGARQQYDELVRINSQFKAVPRVDAPADLKSSIMAQIPVALAARTGMQHEGFLKRYARWFVPSPGSYVVSGAMAGALVMALVFNTLQRESGSQSERFSGTMTPINQPSQKVDQQTLQTGDATAEVTCERAGEAVTVTIGLSAQTGVAVTLAFDPHQFAVSGMSADSSALGSLQASDGLIKFESDGSQSVRFAFRADTVAEGRIRVAITQNGVVAARELATRTESVHK